MTMRDSQRPIRAPLGNLFFDNKRWTPFSASPTPRSVFRSFFPSVFCFTGYLPGFARRGSIRVASECLFFYNNGGPCSSPHRARRAHLQTTTIKKATNNEAKTRPPNAEVGRRDGGLKRITVLFYFFFRPLFFTPPMRHPHPSNWAIAF